MANPDIPAALVVLEAHLVAAGAALTTPMLDVDRGIVTGGRQVRYYWSGEVDPPRLERFDLTGEMVGQRFSIDALWPLQDLEIETATQLDIEMELFAAQVRTRLNADQDLGDHIDNLVLGNAEIDIVMIGNARYVVLRWTLDMSYVEYALAK